MSLVKMLKSNARLALRENWGRAILVLVIFFAVLGVFSGVNQYAIMLFERPSGAHTGTPLPEIVILSVFTLLTILIVIPLEMGVCRWFYRVILGKPAPISEAFVFFESFKKYRRSIWLYVNLLTRTVLWSALFFALPSLIAWVSSGLVNGWIVLGADARINSAAGTMGVVLTVALYILAAVFFIICMNRYSLAMYIFFDDSDSETPAGLGAHEIIKISVRYSKGYRSALFLFELSFIAWALLCVFIVPILFFAPYFITSVSMYAKYIIEKNRALEAEYPCGAQDVDMLAGQEALSADENVAQEYDSPVTVEEPTMRIPSDIADEGPTGQ